MPVGVLSMVPSEEMYRQVTEKVFGKYPSDASDAPEGMIVHSAGPAEQGWYVYDIWESKEAFQRFVDGKLGPAIREVSGEDAMSGPGPQFFEIESLVKP